jgi:hypothetical protein
MSSRLPREFRSTGIMTRRLQMALRFNSRLVNALILLLGIVLVLLSFLGESSSRTSIVLLSVGASVIAAGLVSFMISLYSIESWASYDDVAKWRLTGIYKTRAAKNSYADEKLAACLEQIDIAAFGLKSFRDASTELVRKKVRSGVRIRILCLGPDSPYVSAREKSENEVPGQIRGTIIALQEWIRELQTLASENQQVQLKYYDSLPLEFYFRIDQTLYVGPYLHGYGSQQTITLEFEQPGMGFEYWQAYFDTLWNDGHFASVAV